jgi:predicted RNase H-like HicB family nuclease
MLTPYIRAAMRLAKYEILEDHTYYGEISGFQGVWANAETLEACREELQSTLEDWLILGLRMGHELPVVAGINLVSAEAR